MLVYINKALSDELQHPAETERERERERKKEREREREKGSKPLFVISCGGNLTCSGRKVERRKDTGE